MNERVAKDARLNTSVMLKHYVTEREKELRQASNRTYERILASLPSEVATRYGFVPDCQVVQLERLLLTATASKDWARVVELATELGRQQEA